MATGLLKKILGAKCRVAFFCCLFVVSPALYAQKTARSPDALWLAEDLALEPLMSLRLRLLGDKGRTLLDAQTDMSLPARALLGGQITFGGDYGGRVILGASADMGQAAPARFFVDEAFLDATMQVGPALSRWRLGRQALCWGDGRLLSDEHYADQAARLDALRMNLALKTFELDLFAARLGNMAGWSAKNTLAELNDKDLVAAARVSWRAAKKMSVALETTLLLAGAVGRADLLQVEGNQKTGSQLVSAGFDFGAQPLSLLRLTAAGTLQFGEHRGLQQLAYDLALSSTLRAFWSAQDSLEFGYDLSSGDGQVLDNRSSVFINPLGARHARYGLGDFLAPQNATDLWLRLQRRQAQGRLALGLHRLSLFDGRGAWIDAEAQQLAAAGDGANALLGYELDLLVEAAIHKPLWLGLTYAMFVPDIGARQRRGGEVAHRVIVELNLRFP